MMFRDFDGEPTMAHFAAHATDSVARYNPDTGRPSFLGNTGPASIRYNNPGAMWPGPSSRKFGAIGGRELDDGLGQGNQIAIFDDAIDGAAALFDLYDRVYANRSLGSAISKWSGGNNVNSYLSVFRIRLGLKPEFVITRKMIRDPEFGIPFAKALAYHEAGQEYPLEDSEWAQAHMQAFYSLPSPSADRKKREGAAQVKKAAKKSRTITGALFGLGGVVVAWFHAALEAATEAVGMIGEMSPVTTLASSFGLNLQTLGFGIATTALLFVIGRRISDAWVGESKK